MRSTSRQSRSFVERRRRRTVIGWCALVLAIATWGFSTSRLSFLPALEVQDIRVYGVDDALASQMSAIAWRSLDGTYGGLFSRSNMIIYPKGDLEMLMASASPRVNNVSIKRNLKTLAISVSEKVPEAVVCADLPDLNDSALESSSNCYFADSSGFIFKKADEKEAASFMRYYVPLLAEHSMSEVIGSTSPKFRALQTLVKSIKMGGINVQAVLIKGEGDYEVYAENPGGDSIVVIQMNEKASLELQRDNLLAFWSRVVGDAKVSGKKIEWSEIKLQYPPNVYSRSAGDASPSATK